MNTSELTTELPKGGQSSRRVVEAEFRLPRLDEIQLPEIDLTPIRTVTEQVLLTGIGVGVLVVRGLSQAIKAAHQAGQEATQQPGSAAETLLSLVRKPEKAEPTTPNETRVKVPILPIDNYDQLTVADVLERLPDLSLAELELVRSYEGDHKARTGVLKAIEKQLAES